MNDEQQNKVWSAWINETKKTITIKESSNAKQVFFESREIGMDAINTKRHGPQRNQDNVRNLHPCNRSKKTAGSQCIRNHVCMDIK